MTTELPQTTEPLALKSNEGLGAWFRSAPTEPGHYWVWQDVDTWPCHGVVHAVLVEEERGRLVAWVPFMDYTDSVVCSDTENTWMDAMWRGPVAPPDAPNV